MKPKRFKLGGFITSKRFKEVNKMEEYLNNLESISKRVHNQKSTKVIFLWCDYINSIHKLFDSLSDAEKNKICSIRISYYKSDEGYFCRKKYAYIFMDGEHLPKVYDYEEKDADHSSRYCAYHRLYHVQCDRYKK